MNWSQFKDPASHMCLAGAVVSSWSLTQEVAGLSTFTVTTNIFVAKLGETFRKNSIGPHSLTLERQASGKANNMQT